MGKHKSSHCHIKKCDKEFFRILKEALEEFNSMMKRLHRDLDYVFREEAIRDLHLPIGLLFGTIPIPDQSINGATTVFANAAVPPAPPLTVSSLTPEQLATIRDIIQRARDTIFALQVLLLRLQLTVVSLFGFTTEAGIINFFLILAIEARIGEVLREAAVDIINVLLA